MCTCFTEYQHQKASTKVQECYKTSKRERRAAEDEESKERRNSQQHNKCLLAKAAASWFIPPPTSFVRPAPSPGETGKRKNIKKKITTQTAPGNKRPTELRADSACICQVIPVREGSRSLCCSSEHGCPGQRICTLRAPAYACTDNSSALFSLQWCCCQAPPRASSDLSQWDWPYICAIGQHPRTAALASTCQ